jgi:hypothetical protein
MSTQLQPNVVLVTLLAHHVYAFLVTASFFSFRDEEGAVLDASGVSGGGGGEGSNLNLNRVCEVVEDDAVRRVSEREELS